MGLLSDIIFGTSEPLNSRTQKSLNEVGNPYDDYYGDLYDDAISGDLDVQAEIREEFGDDWEGEY